MTDSPHCAALYAEGETTCDGLYRKEKACVWRKTCKRLRDLCRAAGYDPAELQKRTREELEKLASEVSESGHLKGTLADVFTKDEPAKPKQSKFDEEVWRLHKHFENLLCDHFGVERFRNLIHGVEYRTAVVTRPGTIYPVDRTKQSGPISWQCRGLHNDAIPLARMWFRPRFGAVDLELPLTPDTLRERFPGHQVATLSPMEIEGPTYKSLCRRLGYEGLGLAASMLKRLADGGYIVLPPYKEPKKL